MPLREGLLKLRDFEILGQTLIKLYSRDVKVSCDDLDPIFPGAFVHPFVQLIEARDKELHDAALGCLPEQPGQVEHAGLEREHEDDPLVVLVVRHPAPVAVHVILTETGHRKVLTQGPVES